MTRGSDSVEVMVKLQAHGYSPEQVARLLDIADAMATGGQRRSNLIKKLLLLRAEQGR